MDGGGNHQEDVQYSAFFSDNSDSNFTIAITVMSVFNKVSGEWSGQNKLGILLAFME